MESMMVLTFLVYTFGAFGVAYVFGHAVITQKPREWVWGLGAVAPPLRWLVLLLECPACIGWWIGFGTGCGVSVAGFLSSKGSGTVTDALVIGFALAFYTAGTNFLLGRASGLILLEEKKPEPAPDAPPTDFFS